MHKFIRTTGGVVVILAVLLLWTHVQRGGKRPASVETQVPQQKGRHLELGAIKNQPQKSSESNVILNDPNMSKNWGLANGDAEKAWNVTLGKKDVIVAVIDTGIDAQHKDLAANLWKNPGETGLDKNGRDKASNGLDDDGNGFIDDVHGWNFVHSNNDLTDNHGHGTHIAGIVGAEGGNNFGISGVAPKVSLMILKYYDPSSTGSNNLKNTIQAIEYAVSMGAKVINYSGGGTEYSREEFLAVKKAEEKGILFVAAAGNERSNSDISHYYPANYGLKNIISVTAIDPNIETLPSSNYGKNTVDLAAPGLDIYSTLPGGQFGTMTGTSQATAFVSGVASLVMSQFPTFSAEDVKKYILRTGDEYASLKAKTGTARKLNIFKALTTLDMNVGANGVVTSNVKQSTQFLTGQNGSAQGTAGGAGEISQFGRSLLQSLRGDNRRPTQEASPTGIGNDPNN